MKGLEQFSLKDKVALVTGGGSGIGASCAKTLAQAGAKVLIVGRRAQKLETVKREIESEGGICEIVAFDLSSEQACREVVAVCVEKLGGLDILINNAGSAGTAGSLEEEFDTELYKRTMSIDLDSIVYLIKYAYPHLSENHGSIINVSSIAAYRGTGHVAYTAAKGAIRSMTKVLARKLGACGVRINTIYPGMIETEMTQKAVDNEAFRKHQIEQTPAGRIGRPEDIANCALYLASEAASFVTGQDFIIDGGYTC